MLTADLLIGNGSVTLKARLRCRTESTYQRRAPTHHVAASRRGSRHTETRAAGSHYPSRIRALADSLLVFKPPTSCGARGAFGLLFRSWIRQRTPTGSR